MKLMGKRVKRMWKCQDPGSGMRTTLERESRISAFVQRIVDHPNHNPIVLYTHIYIYICSHMHSLIPFCACAVLWKRRVSEGMNACASLCVQCRRIARVRARSMNPLCQVQYQYENMQRITGELKICSETFVLVFPLVLSFKYSYIIYI